MKSLSTILAAALVAGSCTVALAQGSGGQRFRRRRLDAAGHDEGRRQESDRPGRQSERRKYRSRTDDGRSGRNGGPERASGMQTAPASNTRGDNPQRPAGAKDNTGASTGQGGTK